MTPPPVPHHASDWSALVQETLAAVWPELPDGQRWILSQIQQESAGDPRAVSSAGARGILQLMPATAAEMGVIDPFEPGQNLRGGIRYLRIQFDHMPEIPRLPDRLYWSFASYNAGRGFINKATALARECGQPSDDSIDSWWRWDATKHWFWDPKCEVQGLRPDAAQVIGYVDSIRSIYRAGPL